MIKPEVLDEIEEVERNRRGIARDGYKAEPLIAAQVYRQLLDKYGPELVRGYREGQELIQRLQSGCYETAAIADHEAMTLARCAGHVERIQALEAVVTEAANVLWSRPEITREELKALAGKLDRVGVGVS